jgi:hypothetical protein
MKLRITIFFVFFYITYCTSAPEGSYAAISNYWSSYQGEMNWNDAKAKCVTLNMRLPTKSEFKTAYIGNVTKSWKKENYNLFWTSEEYSGAVAYDFLTDSVAIYSLNKLPNLHVRCIREQ